MASRTRILERSCRQSIRACSTGVYQGSELRNVVQMLLAFRVVERQTFAPARSNELCSRKPRQAMWSSASAGRGARHATLHHVAISLSLLPRTIARTQ